MKSNRSEKKMVLEVVGALLAILLSITAGVLVSSVGDSKISRLETDLQSQDPAKKPLTIAEKVLLLEVLTEK